MAWDSEAADLYRIMLFADGEEDAYESNLMRRIAGLLYISDKESGEIFHPSSSLSGDLLSNWVGTT